MVSNPCCCAASVALCLMARRHHDQLLVLAEAPDLGLEGVEKQEQASQEDLEEEEDLPDEQLAAKTERQLARKGITFEAKQSAKVSVSV